MKFLILCVFAQFSFSAFAGEVLTPNAHALVIAQKSNEVNLHWNELRREAKEVKDRRLQKIVLEFLGTPRFELANRSGFEKDIRKKLEMNGFFE